MQLMCPVGCTLSTDQWIQQCGGHCDMLYNGIGKVSDWNELKKIETRTESWIYTQLFKVFCHVGDRKGEGWGGRRRRERGGGKATRECRGQRFYLLPSLLPFLCKGQITECVQIEESLWRIKICGREDRGKNLQPPKAERRNENYFTCNKPGK